MKLDLGKIKEIVVNSGERITLAKNEFLTFETISEVLPLIDSDFTDYVFQIVRKVETGENKLVKTIMYSEIQQLNY
jgi:hypothetical protein